MKSFNLRKQSGLSLIELLMGVMVLSIFILGLMSLLTFTAAQNNQIVSKVNEEVDAIIGERVIFSDLRTASLSLNNISINDDAGREFFSYIPDVASNSIPADQAVRQLTLSAATNRELVIITLNTLEAPPFMYDPLAAFQFTAPPANMSAAGGRNFVSLNQNEYVNNSQRLMQKNPDTNFWRNGQILMLDTPARIRPVLAGPTIDMNTPPRSSIFIGRVSGSQLEPIVVPVIKRSHPRYASPTNIPSAEYFLETVPSIGGSAPVIRMSAIKIVRYTVAPSVRDSQKVDLFREVHNGTAFAGRQAFANELLRVEFRRESIFNPLISYRLVFREEGP